MYILNGLDYKVMEQPHFTVSNHDLECTTVRINRKCTIPMYTHTVANLGEIWNFQNFPYFSKLEPIMK